MAAVSEPLVEPTLTSRSAWKTLENHSREARTLHRRDLFAGDPQRGGRMTAKRGDVDYADKLLSAMRYQFGGHLEKASEK